MLHTEVHRTSYLVRVYDVAARPRSLVHTHVYRVRVLYMSTQNVKTSRYSLKLQIALV